MDESEGGIETVSPDELIFRRIPKSKTNWYTPETGLASAAFDPRAQDVEGISVERSAYGATPETHARAGPSARGYYVAVFRASDLFAAGIQIKCDPLEDARGHALLPQINIAAADTKEVEELKWRLVSGLCLRVEDPNPSAT